MRGEGHNAFTYQNSRCRCEQCRTAHRELQRENRHERRRRLKADPTIRPHGTVNTYQNWGCRCVPCREAKSRQRLETAPGINWSSRRIRETVPSSRPHIEPIGRDWVDG